ncbi:hypothetical protein [Lacunimicrobium album]
MVDLGIDHPRFLHSRLQFELRGQLLGQALVGKPFDGFSFAAFIGVLDEVDSAFEVLLFLEDRSHEERTFL